MKKPIRQPIRQRVGERIRELRLASGVSQEAFADLCGYARSYMSRVERGLANPSLDAIEAYADVLKVDVKTLFEASGTGLPVIGKKPKRVPFSADGSCFNPTLRQPKTKQFKVGTKEESHWFDDFDEALKYLKSMDKAQWTRPSKAGNAGVVTVDHWGELPDEYLKAE